MPQIDQPATKEGVQELQDYYTIDAEDKDLITMIDKRIQGAWKDYETFKKDGENNEKYWNCDQLKGISLRWHNSRIVPTVVYVGVETMIPIITSRPAEPVISIVDEDTEDVEEKKKIEQFTKQLQKVFLAKYYDPDYPQQELMEMLARHLLLYKLATAKIIWDESMNDYIVEFVHPHKLIIASNGYYSQDVWCAQYLEKTINELIELFPEKEGDLLQKLFGNQVVDLKQFGNTTVGLWEYYPEDGKYVVWKMKDVILQKKLNPYIEWEDKKFDREKNHFDYTKKPIMFLNSQNLGKHVWDDTSPVNQVLSVQDGINLMQRIITDTSKDQGILVGAQEFIDRDELYKYSGAPTDKLSVKGGDPTRALYRVPPKQLQPFVQDNMNFLIQMADNIMGTHATTRGERSGNPTATQDQITKESDYGRIDAIVRGIERLSIEIYNWELQMMVIKYKPEHFAKILGKVQGQKMYTQLQEYNKRGIKIIVKAGSTLPTDKVSQRLDALELAKMNRISNLDLFKRMDLPNPEELAKNLYLEINKPEELYPELAPVIAETNAKSEAQAQAQAVAQQQQPIQQPVPPVPPTQQTMPSVPIAPAGQAGVEQAGSQVQATEHTEAILRGEQVQPFAGIDPAQYEDHLNREFAVVDAPEFQTFSPEDQQAYIAHVIAERDVFVQMQQQGGMTA